LVKYRFHFETVTTPHATRTAATTSRASRGTRLGERLRQLRVTSGLTQTELAGDRFSKEYVSQIERGKTRPTQETIDWLASRLGVDPSFLASGVSADERARVEATLARAEALTDARDLTGALEEFEHVRAAVHASGSPELEARHATGEGWARLQSGEVRPALAIFEQVRSLVEGPEFSDLERADVLFRLGACRFRLSSISTAIALFDEALKLAERCGMPSDNLQWHILTWRSRCRRRQRDWEAAREDVERALELAEGLGDKRALAHVNLQASLIAERNGHWVLARSYAERARILFEELSDRINVGALLNNLGGLQFLLGKPEEATKYLKDAFAVALEVGEDVEAGRAVSSLAQVHLRTGHPDLAEEQARKALDLLADRDDALDEIGNARLVLGRALLDQGRLDDAEAALDEAEDALSQLSSASHKAAAWVAQGDLATARGDDRGAARLFRQAAEALQDFRF
jgi:tetratricopeptide (TPR) repeat protein